MKKIILIAFSFFLFFQNGIGQAEPLLIRYDRLVFDYSNNDFRIQSQKKYEHDEFGNVVFLERKNYLEDGEVEFWRGWFYDYDNNHLLKKRKYRHYNEAVDLWITDFWYEYFYDENDCLILRNSISNFGGGGVNEKVEYERDEECRIISISKFYKPDPLGPFKYISYITRDYHSDEISYEERKHQMSYTGDSLYLKEEEEIWFDEQGEVSTRLWKSYNEEQTVFNFWKDSYEYDMHRNLTSKKGYIKYQDSANWVLNNELNYFLEYDENDFLIESRKEYFSHDTNPPTLYPNFTRTISYENSCEGIPEEINSIYETGSKVKEINVYQGINECLNFGEIDLPVDVYPNPSEGFFEISSPIFKTGKTEISVYSMDGKVLLQIEEVSRSTASSIDLYFLQNGIYLLYLKTEEHFVKSKIVIAK